MRFIGGKLTHLRKVLKLTRKEVEARTGVQAAHISGLPRYPYISSGVLCLPFFLRYRFAHHANIYSISSPLSDKKGRGRSPALYRGGGNGSPTVVGYFLERRAWFSARSAFNSAATWSLTSFK
jgi:hypothetical protein